MEPRRVIISKYFSIGFRRHGTARHRFLSRCILSGNENTVSELASIASSGDLVIPCKCHYGLGWAAECVLYVG